MGGWVKGRDRLKNTRKGERERERGGIRGESQALRSRVRPVVMATAARRDEWQTGESLSLFYPESVAVCD